MHFFGAQGGPQGFRVETVSGFGALGFSSVQGGGGGP